MAEEKELHTARFTDLIYSLHSSAMVQLGKLADPITGEAKRDLRSAHSTIDLLETLNYKLVHGLEENERKMLDQVLTELRLNYVDEKKREEDKETEKTATADDDGDEPVSDPVSDPVSEPSGEPIEDGDGGAGE